MPNDGYGPGWRIRMYGHTVEADPGYGRSVTVPEYSCEIKTLGRGRVAVRITHRETGIKATWNDPVESAFEPDDFRAEAPNILGQLASALELCKSYVAQLNTMDWE